MTGRIARPLTHGLYFLTWACMVGSPAILIYVIVAQSYDVDGVIQSDLVPMQKRLAAGLSVAFCAVIVVFLWRLQRLFQIFRQGLALTETAAKQMRRVGATTCLLACADILVGAAMSVILTFPVEEGQIGTLSVSVTNSEIGLILFGGLLIVIGHVYAEATAAVAENREFV